MRAPIICVKVADPDEREALESAAVIMGCSVAEFVTASSTTFARAICRAAAAGIGAGRASWSGMEVVGHFMRREGEP